MSHPIPGHEYEEHHEHPRHEQYRKHHGLPRIHPRPLSKIASRKGKNPQLHNVVNGWKHSMMSPRQKAIDKAIRRHEGKKRE